MGPVGFMRNVEIASKRRVPKKKIRKAKK